MVVMLGMVVVAVGLEVGIVVWYAGSRLVVVKVQATSTAAKIISPFLVF